MTAILLMRFQVISTLKSQVPVYILTFWEDDPKSFWVEFGLRKECNSTTKLIILPLC